MLEKTSIAGFAKQKDDCWVGDAAMGLAVRYLFATKYEGLPETRAVVNKIVGNKFIAQNTGFAKGDDFEAWVASRFIAQVAETDAWKAFLAEVETALVAHHRPAVRFANKKQQAVEV